MIEKLSEFKPWVLAVAGFISALGSILALSVLSDLARAAWPEATVGIVAGYLVFGAITSYVLVGVAFEAIALRYRKVWFEDALEGLIEQYLDGLEDEDDEVEDRTAYIENPDLKKEEHRHG